MSNFTNDSFVSDEGFYIDCQSDSEWTHVDNSSEEDLSSYAYSTSSGSSSPRSPRSERSSSPDNSMALVRTGPSSTQLAYRPRGPTQPQSQVTVQSPRDYSTQTWSQRRPQPQPQYYQSRPNPRYWAPPMPVPTRSGHNYGTICAGGNSKVIMGNVGSANGRSHNYGAVFTGGDAKVYAGDVSLEEVRSFFR